MRKRLATATTLVAAVTAILLITGWGSAAASSIGNVLVTNDAAHAIPVREQNVDKNGYLAVHEQGTAAVHEQGTANVNVLGTPTVALEPTTFDTTGDLKVHEQGTANVHVDGVVSTQAAEPAHPFSVSSQGLGPIDGCGDGLPAGTRWYISSLSLTDEDTSPAVLTIGTVSHSVSIAAPPNDTRELTFPQPLVLTSTGDGGCLDAGFLGGGASEALVQFSVVGYRQ